MSPTSQRRSHRIAETCVTPFTQRPDNKSADSDGVADEAKEEEFRAQVVISEVIDNVSVLEQRYFRCLLELNALRSTATQNRRTIASLEHNVHIYTTLVVFMGLLFIIGVLLQYI